MRQLTNKSRYILIALCMTVLITIFGNYFNELDGIFTYKDILFPSLIIVILIVCILISNTIEDNH